MFRTRQWSLNTWTTKVFSESFTARVMLNKCKPTRWQSCFSNKMMTCLNYRLSRRGLHYCSSRVKQYSLMNCHRLSMANPVGHVRCLTFSSEFVYTTWHDLHRKQLGKPLISQEAIQHRPNHNYLRSCIASGDEEKLT